MPTTTIIWEIIELYQEMFTNTNPISKDQNPVDSVNTPVKEIILKVFLIISLRQMNKEKIHPQKIKLFF